MVAPTASSRADAPTASPSMDLFRALLLCELVRRRIQADESRQTAAVLAGQSDSDSLLEREIAEATANLADDAAGEVQAALRRIELGSYGVCEGCRSPIALERLEAIPQARLCVRCTAQPLGST